MTLDNEEERDSSPRERLTLRLVQNDKAMFNVMTAMTVVCVLIGLSCAPVPSIRDQVSPAGEIVPYYKVEVKPELIGGERAIADYIIEHDLYPKTAFDAGITGKVLIGFTVGTDGKAWDVKVLEEKPAGMGFGKAGVKVMQAMKFRTGMIQGKRVAVPMAQPISFGFE